MKSMHAQTILHACQKRTAQILDFVPKLKSQKRSPRHGSNKSLAIGKSSLDRAGRDGLEIELYVDPKKGHCRADSDPHIRQFDGNTFDVMGTCLYTLVQSTDKSFKVNIKNYRAWPTSQESLSIKACNVRESNPGLPRGRREFYH